MKYFLLLLLPLLIYAVEPTILEELTEEIGINSMAQKLEIQKKQSNSNTKRINQLSNRLKLMDEKMQDILNNLSNKKLNTSKKPLNIAVEAPKSVINNSNEIVYTLQIYSSYDRGSAVVFFNNLPEFMRQGIKLYKIDKYYVLRYGSQRIRSDLSSAKKQMIQLGYKDIFSVKTSLARFNAAKTI